MQIIPKYNLEVNSIKYYLLNLFRKRKKASFLLPRFCVIAWILDLVDFANLSQGALTAEMEENSLHIPCWNSNLHIYKEKSTLMVAFCL